MKGLLQMNKLREWQGIELFDLQAAWHISDSVNNLYEINFGVYSLKKCSKMYLLNFFSRKVQYIYLWK